MVGVSLELGRRWRRDHRWHFRGSPQALAPLDSCAVGASALSASHNAASGSVVTATTITLAPDQLLELADLVAERLSRCAATQLVERAERRLVSAGELSRQLGIDRSWVYANADALGARRVGNGPRPRLRFDLDEALAALTSRTSSKASSTDQSNGSPSNGRQGRIGSSESTSSRRRLLPENTPLLPIRGPRRQIGDGS